MNLSLIKKLSLITLTALVLLGIFGVSAGWQFQQVVVAQNQMRLASQSLRNQMEAARMPDAVRADVLAALHASAAKDAAAQDEAKKNLAAHVRHFRDLVAANLALPLAPRPAAAVNEISAPLEEYLKGAESFLAVVFTDHAAAEARLPEFQKTFFRLDEKMGKVSDAIEAGGNELNQAHADLVGQFKQLVIITVPVCLLALILVTLMVGRSIPGPFRKIVHGLSATVELANTTSATVADTSQKLAAGAGQSASSLEETGASLEEIASMIKRTATNAGVAKELGNATRAAADTGMADMQAMTRAMDEIKSSSDNIAKIIKTIDEIAFQTNLLALNAAVEAARAGEAGAGFAVVADEVRALAQRSAQAARETTAKIDDCIKKSERGVVISTKVSTGLSNIVDKARKMDELIGEIAAATDEQNLGISQINSAMGQMDNLTCEVAENSGTIATAAEKLRQQALDIQSGIASLKQLVGGDGEKPAAAAASPEVMAETKSIIRPPKNGRRPTAPTNGHTNGHAPTKAEDELPMPATPGVTRFHDF